MLRVGDFTVTRQPAAHVADLTTAHGVRLAGEGKRSTARPAQLASGEMQIDDAQIFRDATGALVGAHPPETQGFGGDAEPKRRLVDGPFVNAAQFCGARR